MTELKVAAKTNELQITAQKRDLSKLQFENEALNNQIAEYKRGVDTAIEAQGGL
jgi:cell division protein FtsB